MIIIVKIMIILIIDLILQLSALNMLRSTCMVNCILVIMLFDYYFFLFSGSMVVIAYRALNLYCWNMAVLAFEDG
jgi:hypothetical protein